MSNNDNIEKAFQERFEHDSVIDQSWNNPSESIWDKIESDLDLKEKSRLAYPFFLLVSGLLLSLIGVGYLMIQNNNLTKQVNEIRIELENCGTKNNNQNSKTLDQKSQSKKVTALIGGVNNSKIPEIETTQPKAVEYNLNPMDRIVQQTTGTKTFNRPKSIPLSGQVEESNNEVGELNLDEIFKIDNSPDQDEERQFSIQALPQINNYVIGRKLIIAFPKMNITTTKNQPKSFLSISGGIIGSSLISRGNQISALTELIDREYAKLGSIVEVKYTIPISKKWSMSGGLGIINQEFITEYDINLPYQVGNEIIENGVGYIDFEHSLPTSFGNTETELRLRRPNADLPLEKENVNIDFNTRHRFLSLSTPLSLVFLGSGLSSGFHFGVDFVPSYIISARSGISSVVSQHSEVESVNNKSTSDYNSLQKLNFAVGGHIGYRYPITEKGGVELSAKYLRNLNSYFSSESFSSKSQGVQFSAGYFFMF
jgi:hypothetical protein